LLNLLLNNKKLIISDNNDKIKYICNKITEKDYGFSERFFKGRKKLDDV